MSTPNSPLIRTANHKDAAPIAGIWNPVIAETTITFTTEPKTEPGLHAWMDASPVWVAEDTGTIAGFCAYGPFRSGPGYADVVETTVFVAPAAQGTGLGRQLMSHLEHQAKAEGHAVLVAGISGENPNAVAFHQKLGFAHTATLPQIGRKFGRRIDLVLMLKTL
ncbi:MAG: N-acetyltransferase family protein [Pseudomonadota bacterium]